ncbi:MAG: LysM peptidoglycan-binding domain-containing protein, partial [Chloroflexi bacterium]|nr:LysM peptidoglycan-binding domain-containing protein [Chloroflexota bacterium]
RVQNGDTIASLAQKFNISPDTILEANNIDDPAASLSPGQDLTILPVTGMLHKVQAGDSIDSIARRYLADPRSIIAYQPNELKEPYQLKEGQLIIVPNGKRPPRDKIITHKVASGETLSDIALRFDISVDTIIWDNNIDNPDSLRDGQDLEILPITGFKHVVKAGETISSIAALHQVDPF